jgi:alpha-mannosidase
MRLFTVEKIGKHLIDVQSAIHREIVPLGGFRYREGDHDTDDRPAAPDFDDSGWQPFEIGSHWGGYDIYAWFRARVTIPAHLRGHKLGLRFLLGPRDGGKSTAEARLYANGQPLQAIDVWHEVAWLPPEVLDSGSLTIALQAWSGVWGPPPSRNFKLAELVRIDEATENLRREQMLQALNKAFHRLDFTVPKSDSFYASVAEADALLREAVAHWAAVEEIKPSVTAVGHAHIDLAWLWRAPTAAKKACAPSPPRCT